MSLRSFPRQPPDARAAARAPQRLFPRPVGDRLFDGSRSSTGDDVNLVEVIDLGSTESTSSGRFIALVGRVAERPPSEPSIIWFHRGPRQRDRPRERRRFRLWPLVIGLLALELVESRFVPQPPPSPPPAAPSGAVATAQVPEAAPRRMAADLITHAPSSPVRRAVRRTRTEEREPVLRASRTGSPTPAETRDDRIEPHAIPAEDAVNEAFTPPRAVQQQLMPRRPAPFPAARGSRTRIEVMVDADGRVEWARLRSAGTSYFDERALEAVRGWRFEPARRGGQPVRAALDVEVASR